MTVKDISFKDYIELNVEERTLYDYYLGYGKLKAEDYFKIGYFLDKSFGFVKDMQYYASKGLTWEIFLDEMSKETKTTEKELAEISIFSLQKARLYIIEEVEKINKIESENLGHQASAEEEQADISRFNSYGSFIQFDKLTNGNLLDTDKIKELPYDICFTKLKLDVDRASYTEDYNKIIASKNK